MTADLIYDVGMNNGDDTAYYLHKGFRVVAVEAKLITQNDHTQLAFDPFSTRQIVKRRLRSYPGLFRLGQRIAGLRTRTLPQRHRRTNNEGSLPEGGWTFNFGSSGPFGEDTDGPWQTVEAVAHTWVAFKLGQSRYGVPTLDVWHDVHATTRHVA